MVLSRYPNPDHWLFRHGPGFVRDLTAGDGGLVPVKDDVAAHHRCRALTHRIHDGGGFGVAEVA